MVETRLTLARIVSPHSVAVIGASDDVGKFGGRVIHYLIKHGFPGRLVPINPNRASIRGLPAFPSIGAAGQVDVAILAVPVAHLLRQVEECAAAGVGACIVITGKLADAGPEGAALEAQILAVARNAGMRLVGPNCLGIFNMTDRAMLSSSLVLEAAEVKAGGIGMVSQSGALMGTLVSIGLHHGAGFSRCISVGNQADLELCDFLEYLVEDPATRVIALYIEGLKDPARFGPLLRRARAAGKPVLCVKAGRSAAGAQAARSHTASLAGSYAAFAALCRAEGAVLCEDPAVMVQAADALDRLPRLPAPGMGLAVVASSGGSTVTTADMLPAAGLRLAEMGEATRAEMRRWMPESHVHLPLDTGSFDDGTSEAGLAACVRAFLADPDIGAVVVPMTTQPAMAARAALFPGLCREGGRPVLFVMTAAEVGNAARDALRQADFPFYDRVSDALGVLRALEAEAEGRDRAALPPPARPPGIGHPPRLPAGALTEAEAKALAAAYGIPVTRGILARSVEEAILAAEAIGYPVVLKGVSRAVVHKSDLGLVKLNLPNAAALRAAYAALPDIRLEGVLVQEMARGEAELILGARWEPGFGPMVLVGAGGVLVELLRDVQLMPAPLRPEDAAAMLRRLALWPVLDGVRGRPALDVRAAVEALVRLSWLAADLGPRLIEMDLNPLLLRAAGRGAVAVDARATIGGESP
ncbi:acetate--CoA ligase family protein [Siccirubricoccus sp. KC 17139]|uniref:Acetate--CoA ligase family protein n=2 Tax=Siccirubricoccus soli TaxID=2899147 RepID=A0ABT1D874_9PROT|nr:acetate--CoA ligase [Siccirubricoccus soli]MCO6417460.1 acetate--CoA ligase family protein [Siccirubricoccus soli]MCP2683595.1 acetate--CoA ligase family protein [Siccirubricoccus soli]